MQLVRYLVWAFARLIVPLRYRIRVHGLEAARRLGSGVVIFPNHPGYVDPALLLLMLWPSLRPRPLVYRSNKGSVVFDFVIKLLNALPIPDLDRPSAEARVRADEAINQVIDALRRGENFIIWPAGHVQRDGTERLGGARAAADILKNVPNVHVVLARTRGLWGSRFSYGYSGTKPSIGGTLRRGVGLLLANLVVFMPRRRIDVCVEPIEQDRLPEPRREVVNPWLEAWYNAGGPETPTFVPYHFLFGPRTREFPRPEGAATADLSDVPETTKETVASLIEDALHRPLTDIEKQAEVRLDHQLGLNSLDIMDLTLAIEQQFGFTAGKAPMTVGELWALARGLVEREPIKAPPQIWFEPPSDKVLLEIKGETIPEAFVARAIANPRDIAAADDLSGVVTYERVLVGMLVMARRFTRLPGQNIGVMLPASVACDIAILALHMAGKLPVVLNWTTGPANLEHAARTMDLTHVISSHRFIDRLGITIPNVTYIWLEEIRADISKWELARTLTAVRLFPGRVRRGVPALSPDHPAVVLFTSGSERAPKAVPLTHRNIISDARSGIAHLRLNRAGTMLGFLPAFHSFGLSVTGIMPLMGGMRVVHHPDPTDAAGLARKIAAYKPTMLVGTPTFVNYILDRAKPGELTSLNMIVVGAEKCPPDVFERCAEAAPGAHLLEGYGITECSPVVAVNKPEANKRGTVGQAIPGLDTIVIDPETSTPMPDGQMGELWVSGAMIFPGYLAYDGPSPFRERDGKRWYATGDLVVIDHEGFIHFRGRQKRFLKAGGEMISLPALEEPFTRLFPPTEDGPRVAVEGIDTNGDRHVVLFSMEPISLRDANARLASEGLRGVMRLDEVRQVEKIPVLGTGKIDYKVLRAQINPVAV